MRSRTTVALLVSLGVSLALGRLQCVNDEVIAAEAPAVTLPAFVKRRDPKPVDVYFHIASTVDHESRITEDIVAAQFEVLRSAFSHHGFALSLADDVSRVVDDVLGGGFYDEDLGIADHDGYIAWRAATRRGGYDALNVYFFTDLPVAVGGVCSFVGAAGAGSDAFWQDGCWINGDTMPGMPPRDAAAEGEEPPVPMGHTAVHEVGHWFGLYHTFRGGACDAVNDMVDDTPAQAGGTEGCPAEGRDSCPDSPGLDPIHNFMDYSDDSCTSEFTPGQEERMHRVFDFYRRPPG